MYLQRNIDSWLENWLEKPFHSPALITGIRQCGKTESIRHFASSRFECFNEINFWKNPEASACFHSLDVDDIIRSLSLYYPSYRFVPGKTLLFLDEIQDCPRARLSLKSFKEDGRFEVIASGSFIGLNLNSEANHGTPMPNGAEDVYRMHTMDFHEFLLAKGYPKDAVANLKGYFEARSMIPSPIHEKMLALFREYLCVGGYPEAVSIFLQTNSFREAYEKNRSLVFDIKGDPSKRVDASGKPLYTPGEVSRIQKAFDLIQSYLLSDNRRYVTSKIQGNSAQRTDAVDYLVNACVATKANNVTSLSTPLSIGRVESEFKLFYADIGLLTASFAYDEIKSIVQGTLGPSKGYLYESAVAESLAKAGIELHYFAKPSGLEIDFVISYQGKSTLVEAKAKNGNTKSAKTIMSDPARYGKTCLLKIGEYNISEVGDILTMPYYLIYLLAPSMEDDLRPIAV